MHSANAPTTYGMDSKIYGSETCLRHVDLTYSSVRTKDCSHQYAFISKLQCEHPVTVLYAKRQVRAYFNKLCIYIIEQTLCGISLRYDFSCRSFQVIDDIFVIALHILSAENFSMVSIEDEPSVVEKKTYKCMTLLSLFKAVCCCGMCSRCAS